jgi:hypothetical protein
MVKNSRELKPTDTDNNSQEWEVSQLACGRLATDPRDHVYGFLGISRLDVVPNYFNRVREVYIEYTVAWLTHSQSCEDLYSDELFFSRYGGFKPSCVLELPSWVPKIRTLYRMCRTSRFGESQADRHIKGRGPKRNYIERSVGALQVFGVQDRARCIDRGNNEIVER